MAELLRLVRCGVQRGSRDSCGSACQQSSRDAAACLFLLPTLSSSAQIARQSAHRQYPTGHFAVHRARGGTAPLPPYLHPLLSRLPLVARTGSHPLDLSRLFPLMTDRRLAPRL
jgi:hypothetical protein